MPPLGPTNLSLTIGIKIYKTLGYYCTCHIRTGSQGDEDHVGQDSVLTRVKVRALRPILQDHIGTGPQLCPL